jgi:hypothetical protein
MQSTGITSIDQDQEFETQPRLTPVPSVKQEPNASALERSVVMGGQTLAKLPAFTVSTRMRSRHILVDTDLTPDEIH